MEPRSAKRLNDTQVNRALNRVSGLEVTNQVEGIITSLKGNVLQQDMVNSAIFISSRLIKELCEDTELETIEEREIQTRKIRYEVMISIMNTLGLDPEEFGTFYKSEHKKKAGK